ncbi:O-antigen ligase family protein [Candidatus Saccharibacteria bacterium]|nr:O-antigen ligase family protein [Candidatus Saccharibacteria bacterium]MDQ5885137.1 hypothetical protein [Patescibacteria group bacterium]MDQ5953726.1 hypothetical protein [Patescibacteria group bacterium]MDQ5958277.1 hypothetical protein [Patescibacteria group bacterium]
MNNNIIANSRFILFIALIVGAPLSKYPSFALPIANFPSFRIGLYQILVLLFVLLCLPALIKQKSLLFNNKNKWVTTLLLLFAILVGASIAWSNYPARSALLAFSVWLLIVLVFCAWWYVAQNITKNNINTIVKAVLFFGILYAIIGIAQFIIGTFFNTNLALLCTGCNANVFGFARISGLAAEPQFFANSLIPFIFIAIYSLVKKTSILAWISLTSLSLTLGLTFSRGAYYAIAISLIVTFLLLIKNKLVNISLITKIILAIVVGFAVAIFILIAGASIKNSSTPDITYKTIDSIAEHVSLGVVDLPNKLTPIQPITQNQETVFVSPGLIEASNTERTSAASLAIKAWRYSPLTTIFGVGVGNLGPFVVKNIDASAPSTLTVYIYYILLLSELGIIGLLLFVTLFIICFKKLLNDKKALSISLFGLLLAFFIQYIFFGSYINVMYIWLWLGISLGITPLVSKTELKHTV